MTTGTERRAVCSEEPLQPGQSKDKVEASANGNSHITHYEVVIRRIASDGSIQRSLERYVSEKSSARPHDRENMLTGHTCAFATNSRVMPPVMKNKLFKFAYPSGRR